MKPLRAEHDPRDAEVARAVRLLEQVGPLSQSRLTQRRVRNKLDSMRPGRAAFLLRPAVALGVLCGFAATAGATWGVLRLATSPVAESSASESAASRPAPAAPKVLPAMPVAPAPGKERASEVPDRAEPAASDENAPKPVQPNATQRVVARASKPVKRSASDAALVHGAVRELRSGGDPERARKMLDEYRSQNPSGVLAEEALALSIEAAVARKDPEAKRLAREYLAQYPNGRFAAAAHRVLR